MSETRDRLFQVLAELELISQVSAVNMDSSGGRDASESIGGKRPPGGINRKDDREHDYPQKSADHFRRRLARAFNDATLLMILQDAETALDSCRKSPEIWDGDLEPAPKTFRWKRMIANSPETAAVLVRRYGISERTVRNYRAEFRTRRNQAA